MTVEIPENRIPETEPWKDRDFLWWAYHNLGLSPRAIAFELSVQESRVTVHMDRLGILRPWRHEATLHRLYVQQGHSVDEIAAREEFDCTSTTVRKYLAEYGLSDDDPDQISYGRLDELGSETSSGA